VVLAHLLDYHRCEAKPQWWEWFLHLGLDEEELIADSDTIGERARGARRAVSSLVYTDVLRNARMPALAREFFCAALVAEAAELRDASASHFLSAAWDQAATVLAFIRELAENGDDQPHSVAEAFAKDD
jgi:hypothetical protein